MDHNQALTLLGSKFYKANRETGEIEVIRVTGVKTDNSCKCVPTKGGEAFYLPATEILGHYTKLINDGVLVFAIVETCSNETNGTMLPDVVILGFTKESFETNKPVLICRQNIIDIFQAIYAASYNKKGDRDKEIVGTCLTRSSLPKNMTMETLAQCDKVIFTATYNTYISDDIDTILSLINSKRLKKFNDVLEKCLLEYMGAHNVVDCGQKHINGHCRDLETLMKNNNFGYDWDSIFNISPVNFKMEDMIIHNSFEDGTEYDSLNSDATNIFSKIFRIKINKTFVVEYDHDIDLSEFDKSTYFLVRDNTGKLYVIRYTNAGEYLESELELDEVRKAMENIAIVNKYRKAKLTS